MKTEETKRKQIHEYLKLIDDFDNDLSLNYNNSAQDIILKIMEDIEEKRIKIISDRLKQILGIELDVCEEERRRFKRFVSEFEGNEEHIYFNDGSDNGIRIVTFVKEDNPISFDPEKLSMSVNYYYY
jgi:hypothetical protein